MGCTRAILFRKETLKKGVKRSIKLLEVDAKTNYLPRHTVLEVGDHKR